MREALTEEGIVADRSYRECIEAGDAAGFAAALAESSDTPSVEGATFKELRVVGFDFAGVDLSYSEWTRCTFEKVEFGDANLQGAYFDHTNFTDCRFEGANLGEASFDGAHLLRTTLAGGTLDDSELEGCQLIECALVDLVLNDVSWSEVTLTRSRLERIKGESGELRGVTLREASTVAVDTSGLTCARCRASLSDDADLPAGFKPLSGRRQRVR